MVNFTTGQLLYSCYTTLLVTFRCLWFVFLNLELLIINYYTCMYNCIYKIKTIDYWQWWTCKLVNWIKHWQSFLDNLRNCILSRIITFSNTSGPLWAHISTKRFCIRLVYIYCVTIPGLTKRNKCLQNLYMGMNGGFIRKFELA